MPINTVLGPISRDQLGVTLTHEHLYCDLNRVTRRLGDLLVDVEAVVQDIEAFASLGGKSICDVTTPDLGRRPDILREISSRTGVQVLMGLGRYREPFYEPELHRRTTKDLAAEFIREATEGIDGVLPALIGEIGVDGPYISPVEERVHRAAARTHLATGLPITTHAIQTNAGLMQLDLFEEEGVDLTFVAIGHCDSFLDDEYHEEIVGRGAFASFDLIRGVDRRTAERQARAIARLVRAGHGKQLLISHDICYHAQLRAYGGNGYTFIFDTFLELLQRHGVTEDESRMLLVDNPARFLSGRQPGAEE